MHLYDLDYSKLRALKLLRRSDGLSRVELAEALQLNKATVTTLTADLLRRGLIVEGVPQAAGRGRPRTRLSIDPDAGCAISLYPLAGERASIDIVNLRGERLFNRILPFPGMSDLSAWPARCTALLSTVIEEGPMRLNQICLAGVVLPGLVDQRRGIVHSWPFDPSHGAMPLGQLIEDELGIPVVLDNRAAVIARAEHWFGTEGERDNFSMAALLELGMNGARYSNGRLQIGYNGMNADFSHVKVAFEDGRSCFCGGTGCLGTYASAYGILASRAANRGGGDLVGQDFNAAFDQVVRAARSGETDAIIAFTKAGRALGTAIASHINEHDPGRFLIIATRADMLDLFKPAFLETLQMQMVAALKDRTIIELRLVEESEHWKGAAALALEALYEGTSQPR